jgi:transposase-like protein
MVTAVRRGVSRRGVAREFGVQLGTVQRWLARAGDERLDRVDFTARSCRPQRTTRIPLELEDLILEIREMLRAESVLGEYGARAIERELAARVEQGEIGAVPALRTIGRVIERRGALERRRRVRRPAPPPGWYLPAVVARRAELDSFDVIEELRLKGGPVFDVLTGVSVQGGIEAAWPGLHVTARTTIDALAGHWRAHGLPGYAQFDNDTRFAGVHGYADRLGHVVRFCLAQGVVPVFAPVRESGFQNAIESFNARWKAKVWRRFFFPTLDDVVASSDRYVAASRARLAARIEAAPSGGRSRTGRRHRPRRSCTSAERTGTVPPASWARPSRLTRAGHTGSSGSRSTSASAASVVLPSAGAPQTSNPSCASCP